MKKWIVLGGFLAILCGLVVIAAMNLDGWLDENRPMIEEEASAAVGRAVSIDDLGVQIWGGFGVSVEGVRIAEDPGYGEGALLTLDRGVLRVSIWPALFGRIEIGEVVLDAPVIRVIRDARGLSVDSLLASDEPVEPEAESELDLSVSEVRIVDGRLIFEDRLETGVVESVIEAVDIALHDVGAERPLSFELSASLLGAESPNLKGEGTAGPVLAPAGAPLTFDVTFALEALALADVLRIEEVAASLPPETRLGGSLDAMLTASGVAEDVRFDLLLDARRLDLAMASDFVKPAGIPMSLAAKGRATSSEAIVEAFSFELAGLAVAGEARTNLDEVGAYEATVRGERVPLGGWGALLPALDGMPVEGHLGLDLRARGATSSDALPKLLGQITLQGVAVRMPDTAPLENLSATIRFDGSTAAVREARFEVGGAAMQLEADVPDLNAPELGFVLTAPSLPLAALGIIERGTEADDQLRELRVIGRADLRSDELEADVHFASPSGRLQAVDYTRLEGRASVAGARMSLDELKMNTLGGEVLASGSLDETRPESPVYDGRIKLVRVSMSELMASRFPSVGHVASGRIDTSMAIGASGLDTDALLRTLSGKGRLDITDGTLHDINLAEEALRGVTGVPGLSSLLSASVREKHPSVFSSGDTRFKVMRAGVEIAEGKLRTDDLTLDTGDFGLKGGGTVGLDGALALETSFTTSPALATSLVKEARPVRCLLDRSGRLVIPLHIGGTLMSPTVKADRKFVGDVVARAAVGTVGSMVGGLLGTGSPEPSPTDSPALPGEQPAPADVPQADPARELESEFKRGVEDLFRK